MTLILPLSEAPKEFHTVLSAMRAYQHAYCILIIDANLKLEQYILFTDICIASSLRH